MDQLPKPGAATGSRIIDQEVWFHPDRKDSHRLTYDLEGNVPVNDRPLNTTNRPISSIILRLHTSGVDQSAFFYPSDPINYDYPDSKQQDLLAESAVFLHEPIIWVSQEPDVLLLPKPQSFGVVRHHLGLVATLSDYNTNAGQNQIVFRFLIAVFYKGEVITSDPTVVNEPFLDEEGG